MSTQFDDPKVFISYSWSPPQHKERVIALAKRLQDDTVDVILDVWDLAPGQDKNLFMEQTVNNPQIKRVFLICNRQYKEKADSRMGGVGTESLIMSKEIYAKADQTKFIPLVFEFDEHGEPYLPTFLHSRIFFDMRDNENFEENYEQLIRNIFDKPTHKKPPRGVRPSYLDEEEPVTLPTAKLVAGIKSAFTNERKNAPLLVRQYYQTFLAALKDFEPKENEFTVDNYIELALSRIEQMLPLRDDFVSFLDAYCSLNQAFDKDTLHDFFEQYAQYFTDTQASKCDNYLGSLRYDYLRFFAYEFLLYFTAVLVKHNQFDVLGDFLNYTFIVTPIHGKPDAENFTLFNVHNYTLNKNYNDKFHTARVSIVADKVKERAKENISFEEIKQADTILHIVSAFHSVTAEKNTSRWLWRPETLVYSAESLPFFDKLISARHFERIKKVFDVNKVKDFAPILTALQKDSRINNFHQRLNWDYRGLPDIYTIFSEDKLAKYQ